MNGGGRRAWCTELHNIEESSNCIISVYVLKGKCFLLWDCFGLTYSHSFISSAFLSAHVWYRFLLCSHLFMDRFCLFVMNSDPDRAVKMLMVDEYP